MGMARTPTRCSGKGISRSCCSPRNAKAPRAGCGSGPAHVLRAELGDGIAAELTEHPVDFAGQDAQRTLHARLAPRGQAVECGAADHDRLRTECERLADVGTTAEAAVDENRAALPECAPG